MQRVALGREDTRGEAVQGIVAVGEEQGLGAARLKSLLGLKSEEEVFVMLRIARA